MSNSTDTGTTGAAAKPGRRPATGSADALMSPARTRRRYSAIGLGVALVAAGALTAGWLAQASGSTVSVVVAAADVPAGSTLEAKDLKTVEINAGSGLDTVPGSRMAGLIGQHAAVNILSGQTLTPDAATPTLVPDETSALVGLTISPGQAPSVPLQGGDRILVVDTPAAQDDPPAATPSSIAATVVSTQPVPDTDKLIVDVTVPKDAALNLAARAATGRIAIIQVADTSTDADGATDTTGTGAAATTEKTTAAR